MANTNEQAEVIKIVHWIRERTTLPVIRIKNEARRTAFATSIEKRMGMYVGASDLFIPRTNGEFHGLFVEVKTLSGKISPNQRKFAEAMLLENYMTVFVFGAEAAIEVIRSFYSLPKDALTFCSHEEK